MTGSISISTNCGQYNSHSQVLKLRVCIFYKPFADNCHHKLYHLLENLCKMFDICLKHCIHHPLLSPEGHSLAQMKMFVDRDARAIANKKPSPRRPSWNSVFKVWRSLCSILYARSFLRFSAKKFIPLPFRQSFGGFLK